MCGWPGFELTDSRWSERVTRFPLRHAYLDIFGMMPAQVRGGTGRSASRTKRKTATTTLSASARLRGG